MQNIGIGSKVEHPKFGNGVIIDDSMAETYLIYFSDEGEKEISKSFDGLVVVRLVERDEDAIDLDEVKSMLRKIVEPALTIAHPAEMHEKWKGGQMTLKPAREDLQSKSVPIDTFFHKIVMIRDRVRVMEQKINSSGLDDQEKVDLQQYITRIYGSLTTFNVLFADKEDHFKGSSGNS